jgi:phenylacetate-CoA ligase
MTDNNKEQERKFKELLVRLNNSPLYKEKLSLYKHDVIGLRRIHTLPLTTKKDLLKAGAFGHLAVDMNEVAQYHESTGTTGEPSASWFTQEDLMTGGKQLKECGVRLTAEDFVLIRFPYAMALPAFLMQQAAWMSGAGVVPASGRTVVTPYPRVLNLMNRLRVTVLAGLPREMELLAETARLVGLDTSNDFPALRAICVAGELMSDKRKAHIEKLWGVPVFNMYGSTETANIATMCECGMMHIVEEDFIVEVLQENGLDAVPQGMRGFAAITTLSHQGSPLLRYFNEDIIAVEASDCACGRKGNKLMHYGRSKDRIRLGDHILDSYDIHEAVYSLTPAPVAWKVLEQENELHVLLDSHQSDMWSEESVSYELSQKLEVPVTVQFITDFSLLNRHELVSNVPSVKPLYIQKLSSGSSVQSSEIVLKELIKRGCRKLADGEFEQARELLKQAASLEPQCAEAHAWLAGAYGRLIETGNLSDKIKLLPLLEQEIREALDLDPSLPIARRMNGSRLLHTPESLGGDPVAAAAEFQYCIDHKMAHADVWVSLGECYLTMGKPDQAAEAWKEALSREPQHTRATELLAVMIKADVGRHV